MIFTPGLSMDKESLFWRYGHTLVEADLRHRIHGGDHAESWREGQDRVQTHILKRCGVDCRTSGLKAEICDRRIGAGQTTNLSP